MLARIDAVFACAGNDTIDGGSGVDTVEFTGPRSHYTVTKVNATTWTVRDNVPGNGDDGLDTLINIERLQFADQMLGFGIVGLVSDNAVPGFGTLFDLLPGPG